MIYSGVAQLVEQVAVNHFVGGSSPSSGAKNVSSTFKLRFFVIKQSIFIYLIHFKVI